MQRADHVVLHGTNFLCKHCGAEQVVLPMEITKLLNASYAFKARHEGCPVPITDLRTFWKHLEQQAIPRVREWLKAKRWKLISGGDHRWVAEHEFRNDPRDHVSAVTVESLIQQVEKRERQAKREGHNNGW